ncbi:MAG: SRPBCC family protein [Bacteroidota bacterium]
MKLLKVLLWIVGIVVVIAGGLLLFTDSETTMSRTAVVEAPADIVFAQVNDLHNWNDWSPWKEMDPEMKVEYQNGGVGKDASYTWKGEEVGSGKLTILESTPNTYIKTALEFDGRGGSFGGWNLEEKEGQTVVTWSMTSVAGMDPLGRAFNLFLDGMLGPDFEKGLTKLGKISKDLYAQRQQEMAAELAIETGEEGSEE